MLWMGRILGDGRPGLFVGDLIQPRQHNSAFRQGGNHRHELGRCRDRAGGAGHDDGRLGRRGLPLLSLGFEQDPAPGSCADTAFLGLNGRPVLSHDAEEL